MSSFISKTAQIGANVILGEFVVIEDDVMIGNDVVIGHHVIIKKGTQISDDVIVSDRVIIGKEPLAPKNTAFNYHQNYAPTLIKRGVKIGAGVIIYRNAILNEDVYLGDLATIRENVTIGCSTIIGRGVSVENNCSIGAYCKLETNVYLTAFSEIADHCFLAPCIATSNDPSLSRGKKDRSFKGVTFKKGARAGVASTFLPGVVLKEDVAVAAGSLVTKNLEESAYFKDRPAKKFKDVPSEERLDAWLKLEKK